MTVTGVEVYQPICFKPSESILEHTPTNGSINPGENSFIPIGLALGEILPPALITHKKKTTD
jgi:hypothetical protein